LVGFELDFKLQLVRPPLFRGCELPVALPLPVVVQHVRSAGVAFRPLLFVPAFGLLVVQVGPLLLRLLPLLELQVGVPDFGRVALPGVAHLVVLALACVEEAAVVHEFRFALHFEERVVHCQQPIQMVVVLEVLSLELRTSVFVHQFEF